jgi:hypothetical protein
VLTDFNRVRELQTPLRGQVEGDAAHRLLGHAASVTRAVVARGRRYERHRDRTRRVRRSSGVRAGEAHAPGSPIVRAVIVCPSANLARQWAREAAKVGLRIEPNWAAGRLPADCHGVGVTYRRVASGAELYRHGCATPTVVVADEPHHVGGHAARGRRFCAAFEPAVRWLLLSGTPLRSDSQAISGVGYDADGLGRPDFTFGYAEAVRDGVCGTRSSR